MRALTLFNHKGGVGKTTLTVELAQCFADMGHRVLLVDADPQCNLSSFYLKETYLDAIYGESEGGELDTTGKTLWSGVRPVVEGRGDIEDVELTDVGNRTPRMIWLAIGDVTLSQYEEELPSAWTESFARKSRGYDVTCALSRLARRLAEKVGAEILMYDVGPNVGALNRAILLDSDYFITPVHTDLYSLRALTTVGRSLTRWITDWETVRQLASRNDQKRLLAGRPKFIGYVSSAFRIYGGTKAKPHEFWEQKLPTRVKRRVVDELRSAGEDLTIDGRFKLGDVQSFSSLPAVSQEHGIAMSALDDTLSGGRAAQAAEARRQYSALAREILQRMGLS